VPNTVYFPANQSPIQDVGNNDGTLSIVPVVARSQGGVEASTSCSDIPGSYHDTCRVDVHPYVSADFNLVHTGSPLCRLTTTCDSLDRYTQTTTQVVYDVRNYGKSVLPIENCDGHPVQSPLGNDKRCQGVVSTKAISHIGKEEGIGKIIDQKSISFFDSEAQ
jgi:hypothetical protein